jgi:hypothetical protein
MMQVPCREEGQAYEHRVAATRILRTRGCVRSPRLKQQRGAGHLPITTTLASALGAIALEFESRRLKILRSAEVQRGGHLLRILRTIQGRIRRGTGRVTLREALRRGPMAGVAAIKRMKYQGLG